VKHERADVPRAVRLSRETAPRPFRWHPPPRFDSFASFAFLSIDVIGHSKLLAAMENQGERDDREWKLGIHRALENLEDFVKKRVPSIRKSMIWHWAGDGGLLAFPLGNEVQAGEIQGEKETVKLALKIAERIVDELHSFNRDNAKKGLHRDLALRVVLHLGQALFARRARHRRSTALNIAAKIRFPSDRSSLTITRDFHKSLGAPRPAGRGFIALDGQVDPVKGEQTYGYVPCLVRGLQADLAQVTSRRFVPRTAYELALLLCAAGDRRAAQKILRDALDRIRIDEPFEPFWYRRSWSHFLEIWHDAFEIELPLSAARSVHSVRLWYLRSDEVRQRLQENWGTTACLLADMELILAQTRMLADRYVDAPSGLSTLQICRLLLRSCHSPADTNIRSRLDRIENELEKEGTVDDDCSLCTGVAISCLVLGDRSRKARDPANWLAGLREYRYCYHGRSYTGAPKGHHALHYAAAVLEGFCDWPPEDTNRHRVRSVLGVFRGTANQGSARRVSAWMRYRNISELEVYSLVFSAILKGALNDRIQLGAKEARWLVPTLGLLARRLKEEKLRTKGGRNLYAVRENLASFALARFLDTTEGAKDRDHVLKQLRSRAEMSAVDDGIDYHRLLDSNVDRTRNLVEGWLCHWESELQLTATQRPPSRR
jgi:hypothetical protein